MNDGILWVAAANLVIWTGLFLYLLRLDRRVKASERKAGRS
jgi:CcmD family protein